MEITVRAEQLVEREREIVFRFVTAPDAVGRTFTGFGPIPRAHLSRSKDGEPLRPGAVRIVENADGSVVEEEIVELEAPERQAYVLVRGLPPAFERLAERPRGRWTLTDEDGGTRITWDFTFPVRSWWAAPFVFVLSRFFRRAMARCLLNTATQLKDRES